MKYTKKWQVVPYNENTQVTSSILQDTTKSVDEKLRQYKEENLKVKEESEDTQPVITTIKVKDQNNTTPEVNQTIPENHSINDKPAEQNFSQDLTKKIEKLESLIQDIIENKATASPLSTARPIAKGTRLSKKKRLAENDEPVMMETDATPKQNMKNKNILFKKTTKAPNLERTISRAPQNPNQSWTHLHQKNARTKKQEGSETGKLLL